MFLTGLLPQRRLGVAADDEPGSVGKAPVLAASAALARQVVTWCRALTYERKLQICLGSLWVVDAGLQAQPYMFSRSFAGATLMAATDGDPHILAALAEVAARLVLAHPVLWNELFVATQLTTGVLILRARSVKLGLALSAGWGLVVWVLGEGLGGILAPGTTPFAGAPGAAILYTALSALLWPSKAGRRPSSVAEASPLGKPGARAGLFAVLGLFVFESWPRTVTAERIAGTLRAAAMGEPHWLSALDRGWSSLFTNHGVELLAATCCLFAFMTLTASPHYRWRRVGIGSMVAFSALLWLLQDFGGVATGAATDVNSAPLLALLALCFWPLASNERAAALVTVSSPEVHSIITG